MNKVILMGRLTRDPEMRNTQDGGLAVTRYTLAVDRRVSRNNQQNADQPTTDFISCVAFGRSAEFADKYFHKVIKIVIEGRIQTGRYTNKDGQTVYTTDVVVENQEFAESKNAQGGGDYSNSYSSAPSASAPVDDNGFSKIPDGIDEELPFG